MKRTFAAAAFIALAASCAVLENIPREPGGLTTTDRRAAETPSLEEQYDRGYWVTRPQDGVLTVLGIAGRQSSREKAAAEALADAARRAALYHGVQGESAAVLNQGSGNLDYFSDFDYRLTLLHDAAEYTGDLVFDAEKDVLEKNGIVMIRARYSGVSAVPLYETILEEGVPDWVRNYAADIPGFLTAVGGAKNKGTPQKTYQGSYENAIASLLPRLSSRSANEVIDVDGVRVTQNISISSGVLEQVMILETWVDRKTNTVWTLLAAKQKN
jgi:hypothetical protein